MKKIIFSMLLLMIGRLNAQNEITFDENGMINKLELKK